MSKYAVKSIQFHFGRHFTRVEVICSQDTDGTLGVGGCHFRDFDPSRSAQDILQKEIASGDYLLWPLDAPLYRQTDELQRFDFNEP